MALETRTFVLLLVAVATFAATVRAEAIPREVTPVLTTNRSELAPFAAAGWLGWSEAGRSGRPHLMVMPDGGEAFRVNPEGTTAFYGAIEGDRLTYDQQAGKDLDAVDVAFYDLSTRSHTTTPPGINTKLREDASSSSGDWLLFRRSKSFLHEPQTIMLRNLVTGEERVVGRGDGGGHYVQPGTVKGDYATWFRCHGLDRCDVFRYQISTGATTAVSNPRKRAQFAASVTDDGTVYFVESPWVLCGRRPALWRFTPAGVRERLASLPDGTDGLATYPLVTGSATTVFFDATPCTSETFGKGDIYSLTV